MSATVSTLLRHRDISGVSGVGPVATVCEFGSGLTAVHWDSETPSVAIYTDVRHVLNLHGHKGASTLVASETRLEASYRRVMPLILASAFNKPLMCAPHPDMPDRLRLVFQTEVTWRRWIALLDGSTDVAVHEEVAGEMVHRWVSSDGNLWLTYATPLTPDDEHPLTTFDREDRG